MTRDKLLIQLFDNLQILYSDVNRLIIEYQNTKKWEMTAYTSWKQKGRPTGIFPSKHLWVCDHTADLVFNYSKHGKIKKQNSSLKFPYGIEMDEKHSLLYIANKTHVTVFNLKLEKISSWSLPSTNSYRRGIKLEDSILYITIEDINQIFLCQTSNGEIIKTFGDSGGSGPEQFLCPLGLTLNNKYLYVCDNQNNRIQIVLKENGKNYSKWGSGNAKRKKGEFYYPKSIYYYCGDELFYIGDDCSVQLFEKNGVCIQRLGDNHGDKMTQFCEVFGICIMDEHLYISD